MRVLKDELESAVALFGADKPDHEVVVDEPVRGGEGRGYLGEIRSYPLLDRDEEHELAVKYAQTGDRAAAQRLVTANLRLVVKLAREYRGVHLNLLDLVQEGNLGLVQAVEKYDPNRGVRLSTYASWWIRAFILKFILDSSRLVRLGTTEAQRKLFFNLRKEQQKLEALGIAPTAERVAARLGVPARDVESMDQRMSQAEVSLDAPLGHDDEGSALRGDMLPASEAWQPDVAAERIEFRERLHQKLVEFGARLEGRDRILFDERLLADEPRTLQEVGDRFGISRERTRQVERALLDKLKVYLERELGTAEAA
jgi:RNA polymerase sigma-32 factor